MTPQIFAGLGQPKSKLFFDLQAMIARNGGRLRLPHDLECEAVKSFMPHAVGKRGGYGIPFTQEEDLYMITHHGIITNKSIANVLKRTLCSVDGRLHRLKKMGLL